MKKNLKLVLGLTFIIGLLQPVSAKEMRLMDSGFLFNKENKKIVFPQDKKIFEVNEGNKDSSWDGYNVEYKGQKYFVNSEHLMDPDLYNRYLNETKVKLIPSSNDDVYRYVDFINRNEYLQNIIDNFAPVGFSDLEQVREVMICLKMLNLRYAWNDDISQWDSIQYGYSACHGIAYLQKLLLDKTDVEYRVVFEQPANYLKNTIDPVSPAHILLEVKINHKWYTMDATQLLRRDRQEGGVSYEEAKHSIDYMLSNALLEESNYKNRSKGFYDIAIDPEYPDVISKVSGTYRKNKKIRNDGFEAWYSSKSLGEFRKDNQTASVFE